MVRGLADQACAEGVEGEAESAGPVSLVDDMKL